MAKLGITLPMLNNTPKMHAVLARDAEDAGFASVFSYEFYRTPYMALGAAAATTDRIALGTGLGVALTRTPFLTANLAADIDELSDGRMILGLGCGSPEFLAFFHDIQLDKPIARMRDYVNAVKASWDYLDTGIPVPHKGPFYNIEFPPFMPFGQRPLVRKRIPIYLAAVGPKMVQLVGEVADGLMGAFFSPSYLREVVAPNLKIGAARAGRDPSEIDITAEIICCVHPDREEAMRRARIQVGMYAAHPLADAIVNQNGLQKEQQEVREALFVGGAETLEKTTSDALVDVFSISGTPDECRAKLVDYTEVLDHVLLHTPYVPPLEPEVSQDAFRQILSAFS